MKPSKGRIVHVAVSPDRNNGADSAPGIITRVWSDTMINLRLFADAAPSDAEWMTSVPFYATRADLEAANSQMVMSAGARPPLFGAYWPEQVPRATGDRPPRY